MLCTEDLEFESYGQSEPLTTRLNNILRDYPDGTAVLKELVQNADDAGATEVKFLYDERQNTDARNGLIDKGMTDLQGPAMWAYNDAVFTSQDFDNLIKLSGGTKEQNRSKIGRFGLGFNAVYNLTDVPSLVSQNHVVFLDPHTSFLGGAIRDKSKPGIKLDIQKNRDRIRFLSGQFKPYNGLFGCDFSADSEMISYTGTLFRFPLRTPEQACTSEISKKHYSRDEVLALLKLLIDSSHQFFLFTQHISNISVYHLSSSSSSSHDMKQWFVIEKKVERILRPLNNVTQILENKFAINMECGILDSVNKILCKSASDCIPEIEHSIIIEITSTLEDEILDIMKMNSKNEITRWLTANCMGRGKSFAMAKKYTEFGLTPVGGVAAKLKKTDAGRLEPVNLVSIVENCEPDCGQLFCFLPLPILTGFPVHINGSFAVTSSRMKLHETTVSDKTDIRGEWNEVLISDAIMKSYVILLEDLQKICTGINHCALWPVHTTLKESKILHRLTDSLYRCICEQNGPKLLKCERLISVADCTFLEPSFRHQTEEVGRTARRIFCKLRPEEAADIPLLVVDTTKQSSAWEDLKKSLVSMSSFFDSIFVPAIQVIEEKDRDELVLYALFDSQLINIFRDVAFFPVKPLRKLKTCQEMVHPKCRLAILYDEENECFPADITKNCARKQDDVYRKLVELGMKENELSWMEIADRCLAVPKIPELVPERLSVLIQLMSSKNNGSYSTYVERIKKIDFLPTAKKPLGYPLKWAGDEIKFTSCEKSYLESEVSLVSCSFPIINERKTFDLKHNDLKSLLGLRGKPVLGKHLLCQLKNVIELADSNGVVSGLQLEQKDIVRDVCRDVYVRLNECARENNLSDEVLNELRTVRCIVLDDNEVLTFMNPSHCAFQLPERVQSDTMLLPYLAKIPSSFKSVDPLLSRLQVRQKFELTDYIEILKSLYRNSPGEPLGQADLKVALCIVNNCLIDKTENLIESIKLEDLFIPNNSNILVSADKIFYGEHLGSSALDDIVDEEKSSCLCHPQIPAITAKQLGLNKIRGVMSCEMEFGQSERLVNRIRRILTGYPFDKEVLKEMLQNADDAGATEIHFINDIRQLPTERVFADKWKPMQGPALCIYNNKPFTTEDISGIQKLGEGSKSEDPTKTEKYGVGFNCVYHLTDAPTFLTQVVDGERVLCVFDPTCSFVPRVTIANPGRMMKSLERLKEKFPDVFKGYFEETYGKRGGTMFRLPLRSQEIATNSKLLKKVVTSSDVQGLFETFKSDMFETLLFLNSVEEIHLKEADLTGELKTIYSVKVKLSADARQHRLSFKQNIKKLSGALKSKQIKLENVAVQEVSYELISTDSEGNKDTWHIIQRLGFESSTDISKELDAAYVSNYFDLLPVAGIAYSIDSTRKVNHSSRLFDIFPLAVTINFPAHVNGHFALQYETRRSLWIDDRGGPKVEWNKCMMTNIVAPAFCRLIQERRDAICKTEDTRDYLFSYHLLFPTVTKQDISYIRTLSVAIYKRIETKNLAILALNTSIRNETEGRPPLLWLGPKGTDDVSWNLWTEMGWKGSRGLNGIIGHFYSITQNMNSITNFAERTVVDTAQVLFNTLVECGFLVYDSPWTVYKNFKQAGVEMKLVDPEAVVSFFSTYNNLNTLCNIEDLPRPISHTAIRDLNALRTLLQYCVRCTNLKQKLLGLPLQATADGVLHGFDRGLVKYEPRFKQIVPHIQSKFLDDSVFATLRLDPKRDLQLCKEFTVADFAQVLQGVLPAATFYGVDKFVEIQEMIAVFKDPRLDWIQEVWVFLSHCGDVTPLNKWCLLPVRFNGKNGFFPIEKHRCIVTFKDPAFPQRLRTTLDNIGLPEPQQLYLRSETLSMYNSLLHKTKYAETIVRGFQELLKFVSPNFTLDECIRLLQYFSETLNDWVNVPNGMTTVKQLRIFITVYDKRVTLSQSNAYIIPKGIPNTDMDSWTSTKGLIFLRSQNEEIDLLLQRLNCRALSETDVYCNYIFLHFDMLTPKGRYDHLKYVKDKLLVNIQTCNRSFLIQSLRLLKFLPSADGSFRSASEVYDNTHEVFLAMERSADLPLKPFNTSEWNRFLRTCGMVSVVTPKMFLKYAKTVELNASIGINDEVCNKSKVLVEHLCKGGDIISDGFLGDLKSVAFVLPHGVDQTHSILHIQYGQRDDKGNLKFIPLNGAILSTYSTLVWSAQPILPSVVRPLLSLCDGKYAKCLEINEGPLCETVINHTNNFCQKWILSMHEFDVLGSETVREVVPNIGVLASVLTDIYNFFNENLACTNDDDLYASLRETPFILDAKRRLFLRPGQVAEHLSPRDEIYPYLVRIPSEVMQFATLFKALGATEDATIGQYVMVLESIHANTKGDKLSPEDRATTIKAIDQLFRRFKKHDGHVTLQTELYLLGNDDRIHKSCDLVVDNSYSIRKRLLVFEKPFLIDLQKECTLRFSERQLESVIKKLPANNQPSFLASIVKDEISRDFITEESAFALRLERKLHSSDFKYGLIRLAHHRIAASEGFNEESMSKALEGLNKIRVLGVDKIKCYLVFKGRQIPNSERQCSFFVEQEMSEDPENYNIYMVEKKLKGSYTAETSLYIRLVDIIQSMTGDLAEHAASYVSCMLKSDTNAIEEILDDFDIKQFTGDNRSRRHVSKAFLPHP